MTFCLKTIIIKPENDMPIKNAIIFLPGYGGDAKDISMININWKMVFVFLLALRL